MDASVGVQDPADALFTVLFMRLLATAGWREVLLPLSSVVDSVRFWGDWSQWMLLFDSPWALEILVGSRWTASSTTRRNEWAYIFCLFAYHIVGSAA